MFRYLIGDGPVRVRVQWLSVTEWGRQNIVGGANPSVGGCSTGGFAEGGTTLGSESGGGSTSGTTSQTPTTVRRVVLVVFEPRSPTNNVPLCQDMSY